MQGTIRQLLHFKNEVDGMNGSIMAEFLRPKIRQFHGDNAIRINSAYDKIRKLRDEYLKTDDAGNAKFVGEGKDRVPVFKTGKTQEDFDKAYNELLESEVTIKI